jgi:hypothetical protein
LKADSEAIANYSHSDWIPIANRFENNCNQFARKMTCKKSEQNNKQLNAGIHAQFPTLTYEHVDKAGVYTKIASPHPCENVTHLEGCGVAGSGYVEVVGQLIP